VAAGGSTKHIIQSLFANMAIATAKGVAAALTGSGAMLAETIHSGADCVNQVLLLLGVKRAQKSPDSRHPLGYGRDLYFWSFIVALLLFSGGGVFSIYEGYHKLLHPEPVTSPWIGIAILIFSILLEGAATISNVRELNKRRGSVPFMRYLRDTKDSDLVVVFGENSAATIGLLLALAALVLTLATGDPLWDSVGSLGIGVVLVGVAIFLGVEIKSLLVGEAADATILQAAHELAGKQQHFRELYDVVAVQQGPGEVLFAAKVRLTEGISSEQVCEEINAFEAALRARYPEVKWSFVEPDVKDFVSTAQLDSTGQ
jgi:cation diffusion facilitator family transporter